METDQTLHYVVSDLGLHCLPVHFQFRYVRLYDIDIPKEKWLNYLQAVETDQTLHYVVSDLGLHCLPVTR